MTKNGKNKKTNESDGDDPYWLDHKERRNRSHFGRWPSRRERARDSLMRDWFGDELAREEILSHRRPCQSLADSVPELMKELGKSRSMELGSMQLEWPKIVGADVADRTKPVFMRDGVLTVEVLQPAWLYALKTSGRPAMLEKVSRFTEGKVTDIRFVPGGRDRR